MYSSNYKTFTEQSKIADWSNLTQDQEWNYIWARITYTNWQIREKRSTWKLTNEVTSQIENLKHLNYKVDETIDLTQWGKLNITNASIEMDWEIITIWDPKNFTPDFPWPAWTFTWTINWEPYQFNISIAPKEYHPIQLQKINPTDSLPKIDSWNKNIAEDLERYWYVSARCIIDMAEKYWLWNLNASEYKNEVKKYYVGIVDEIPDEYDNYTLIWSESGNNDHSHANMVWSILDQELHNSKVNKVALCWSEQILFNLADENPSNTYILWKSVYSHFFTEDQYNTFRKRQKKRKENYDKRDNIIYAVTASNIELDPEWNTMRWVCQENKPLEPGYLYTDVSFANWEYENKKSNILVVTWCKSVWDFNISNITSGPKIPSWFSPTITYWGVPYPYKGKSWAIFADDFAYTSLATPNTVATIALCAQICPEIKWNDLLYEIWETSDTRNMTLNNETVQIKVASPRWMAKKHLIPRNIPTEIRAWEFIILPKWKYWWVIFDIPGFEVFIEWKWWIPYNNENKPLIFQYNPFKLDKRLNWTLARKYLWKGTAQMVIRLVKDNWEDILINEDFYINIK